MRVHKTPKVSKLTDLEQELPLVCDINTLLEIGLYRSRGHFHSAKQKGICPDYFYLSPKLIRFHKQAVLDWLASKEVVENG